MADFEQFRYGFGKVKNDDGNVINESVIDNWPVSTGEEGEYLELSKLGTYLSIQTLPGVKIWTKTSDSETTMTPILIGSSGILEIDFSNENLTIPSTIQIDHNDTTLIKNSPQGYIIVNIGLIKGG